MSYLTVPRVHWAGQFLASPSTINNRESNYRTAPPPQFPAYPTYPPSVPPGAAVLWNPMGVALFQLDGRNVNGTDLPGCTVQSVMPASGALVSSPDADALVGASIQSSNQPSSAKIVDLDPEQQLATQLFGLQIQMVFADGTPGFSMKTGQFVPVPNLTDYAGTGCFETAIAPGQLDWNPAEVSPLYKSFRDACQPCGISVRFLVNDYDGDPGSPTFNFGTIVGALGPARPGEPARCSVGRKFLGSNGAFNAGYLEIDAARSKVVIDFGNAPPRFDYVAGKSPELEAGVTRSGATTPFGGPLDYSAPQYTLTSGILEVDLVEGVEGAPVSILRDGTPVMSEFVAQPGDDLPTGAYVMPTRISQRLSYGEADSDPVELVARRFGQPLAGQSLAISLSSGGSGLTSRPA
ncbi:MAG: hypothetical protein R3325_07475 [Thermoanaerobaculia bacterium]|nr:hypothetical protein [Thermoanaerobaculia bacterium]